MNKIEEIKKLAKLFNEGAITQEEFNLLKKNVLAQTSNPIPTQSRAVQENKKTAEKLQIPNSINTTSTLNDVATKSSSIGAIAFIVIIAGFVLFFAFGGNEGSSSRSNNTVQEKERKICNRCKGTGIEICNLCGGTGVDNLGITCLCVRSYDLEKQMGHKPYHPPLQWTCTHCKGTGYAEY